MASGWSAKPPVQTFLPYPDFEQTAACLDCRRLGKQRVEVLQILNTLFGISSGWSNHPVVRQWRGYEAALISYGIAVCNEWKKRGYKDTCLGKITSFQHRNSIWPGCFPQWLGNDSYHSSHRAALLFKDFNWYSSFGWKEEAKIDYIWPV